MVKICAFIVKFCVLCWFCYIQHCDSLGGENFAGCLLMCPCFIVSGFIKLNYQRVASSHTPPRIAWLTMGAKDWKLLHAYSEDWSGCAYWSLFTGRPYRKIHCLFVCFFITNNKWAVFISCDMRWSGFVTSQNTSYPRHPTSQYTVDLSLLVTWIERSVCTAPRGSVDRRGLKRTSKFVTLFLKRDAWQLGLFFVADYHIDILPYQQVKLA